MTAEVAILNKQAVALAADSAVTIGNAKVFNTVNKLFELDRNQPVGIMIYSSAEIMEVPVETVVKEFRNSKYAKPEESIGGVATQFEKFLHEDDVLFPEDARRRSLTRCAWNAADWLQSYALTSLKEELKDKTAWDHPTRAESYDMFDKSLKVFEKHLEDSQSVPSSIESAGLAGILADDLKQIVESFELKFPLDDGLKARIRHIVVEQFFRKTDLSGETGIVIAGFGTSDVFPGIRSMEFQCSALGVKKCHYKHGYNIGQPAGRTAQVIPFAQKDVMQSFMDGRHPHYDQGVQRLLESYFEEAKKKQKNAKAKQVVDELAQGILGDPLREGLNEMCQTEFVQPTMDIVSAMPKDELAILAEALINLTSLKRKASRDMETVGGPTDVAVISKHDGFVWIRRKHYFDAKYNPGFMFRHYGGKNEKQQI